MNETVESAAEIGAGTIVQTGVVVGFRYHRQAGPARIGAHGILRMGTLIYGDVTLGDYFQTGHYVIIRAKVRAGDYCTVCNHSTLEGLIRMGDGVRIMSHVYIPTRTWFGSHVFVGPGVTFLNDARPGRWEGATPEPRGAFVEDEVMIGGGCTILPGVRIGKGSFIAAGALVTRNIPPNSFAKGRPARCEPMPASLDRNNDRKLTLQPRDIWHPDTPDLAVLDYPPEWPAEPPSR